MTKFGKYLKKLRVDNEMGSRVVFCKKLKYGSQTYLTGIEHGTRIVPSSFLSNLIEKFPECSEDRDILEEYINTQNTIYREHEQLLKKRGKK